MSTDPGVPAESQIQSIAPHQGKGLRAQPEGWRVGKEKDLRLGTSRDPSRNGFQSKLLPLPWQGQQATTAERLWAAHLVIVEDGIGHGVLPWHRGGPQLLHEEHLVGERGHDSCGRGQLVTQKIPAQKGVRPSTSPGGRPDSGPTQVALRYGPEPGPAGPRPRMIPGLSLTLPSLTGRAFFIQSVRCRTKSKKKSFSGTLMT